MSTEFFHGVQGHIVRTEGRPVTAIRSSIIGMVVTAGKGPVNKPTLVFGNLTDA
jgi:phage tail sheath protein FI